MAALIFLPVGIAVIVSSDGISEIAVRYDHIERPSACIMSNLSEDSGYPNETENTLFRAPWSCPPLVVRFNVSRRIPAPVFIYYKLENLYQNHRMYIKSVNTLQLSDEDTTLQKECRPFLSPGEYKSLDLSQDAMDKINRDLLPNGGNETTDANGTLIRYSPLTRDSEGSRAATMVQKNSDDTPFDATQIVYNPCGLIPWSMFNDTIDIVKLPDCSSTTEQCSNRNHVNNYSLASILDGLNQTHFICKGDNYEAIGPHIDAEIGPNCHKKGIVWPTDLGYRFNPPRKEKPYPSLTHQGWPNVSLFTPVTTKTDKLDPTGVTVTYMPSAYSEYIRNGWYLGERGHSIPQSVDLDLIVWLRIAPLSTFQKLYRRIDQDLEPGNYSFIIHERYDVSRFGGSKSVVLTTTGWMGQKNYILGILYLLMGSLFAIFAIAFSISYILFVRPIVYGSRRRFNIMNIMNRIR